MSPCLGSFSIVRINKRIKKNPEHKRHRAEPYPVCMQILEPRSAILRQKNLLGFRYMQADKFLSVGGLNPDGYVFQIAVDDG